MHPFDLRMKLLRGGQVPPRAFAKRTILCRNLSEDVTIGVAGTYTERAIDYARLVTDDRAEYARGVRPVRGL